MDFIPKENILLVDFEYLKISPENCVHEVMKFIGVDKKPGIEEYVHHNSKRSTKFKLVQKVIIRDNLLKRIYQILISKKLRLFINRKVVRPIENWNLSAGKATNYNKVNERLDRELIKYKSLFAEDTKTLDDLNITTIR